MIVLSIEVELGGCKNQKDVHMSTLNFLVVR